MRVESTTISKEREAVKRIARLQAPAAEALEMKPLAAQGVRDVDCYRDSHYDIHSEYSESWPG